MTQNCDLTIHTTKPPMVQRYLLFSKRPGPCYHSCTHVGNSCSPSGLHFTPGRIILDLCLESSRSVSLAEASI